MQTAEGLVCGCNGTIVIEEGANDFFGLPVDSKQRFPYISPVQTEHLVIGGWVVLNWGLLVGTLSA